MATAMGASASFSFCGRPSLVLNFASLNYFSHSQRLPAVCCLSLLAARAIEAGVRAVQVAVAPSGERRPADKSAMVGSRQVAAVAAAATTRAERAQSAAAAAARAVRAQIATAR